MQHNPEVELNPYPTIMHTMAPDNNLNLLTVAQEKLIKSYESIIDKKGFSFPEVSNLPPHGKETISDKEIEYLEQFPMDHKFRGQQLLTMEEYEQSANALLDDPAFIKLYEDSIPVSKNTQNLVTKFDDFYRLLEKMPGNKDIPLLNESIRKVVIIIFTRLPKYDSQSVYRILSAGGIYGLFHRFCTQSYPVGINPNLKPPDKRSSRLSNIASNLLPHRLKRLKKYLTPFYSDNDKGALLDKETKWQAIDQETRTRLSHEMFDHVKKYLTKYSNKRVIIIEPGGGNAELSVILAQLIAEDKITAGRAKIIVREFNHEMTIEGKEKIEEIEKEKEIELDIDFIVGSAINSLKDDLKKIKRALIQAQNNNLQEQKKGEAILNKYGLIVEEAEYLIYDIEESTILGVISTYSAGAMSNESGTNTTAIKIFSQALKSLHQDGLAIFADFAAPPPIELSEEKYNLSDQQKEQFIYLRQVAQAFRSSGLSKGLEVVYGLWGEGVGHDIRQIWQMYYKFTQMGIDNLTIEANLKPFSIIPTIVKLLVVPGFMEATIRCSGQADNEESTIKLK